jgi:hypothetical protein
MLTWGGMPVRSEQPVKETAETPTFPEFAEFFATNSPKPKKLFTRGPV